MPPARLGRAEQGPSPRRPGSILTRSLGRAPFVLDRSGSRSSPPPSSIITHRWTSTGILECVSTLTVSLPRTIAAMPRRPCEAITMRSQPFDSAVSMIAR
jgi:hypothetical protein